MIKMSKQRNELRESFLKKAYSKDFGERVREDHLFFSLADIDHLRGFLRKEYATSTLWSKDHHRILMRLWLYYDALLDHQDWSPSSKLRIERTMKFLEEWIEESARRIGEKP